ncbi:MAG TPA: murein biosynthesis integral membrane protein MurJ [Thermomicrobiales bacterium]
MAAAGPITPDAASRQTPAEAQSHLGRGIAGAAMLIMLGNVLSRLLGMAREQLAAGLFGTGDEIAAFTIADNVATLLFDLLISGMLQAALVPVLAQWAAPNQATREELRRISGALLSLALIVSGITVAIGVLFAPQVVRLMTALGGEDARDPATTALTITLVRIILPAVVFLTAGTVMMGVLYALERVTAPALSVAVRNAAVVVAIAVFAGPLGVKSMAIGVVAGAALIAAMQIPPLRRAGALPRPNLAFGHPAVRRVLRLYVPIFLGLIVNTVATVVDRNLAWGAERDALGAMRYATTLVQLVLGLVAAAISLAALPTLSRHFSAGDEERFRTTLGRALAMTTVLILPAVLGLAAISRPTVDLLFHHGATDETGARLIVVALLGYLPGTLFAAYDQILIFAFYARQNTRTPVIVGVVAIGIYFLVALSLVNWLGMLGLVLANSAQFIGHALIMWYLARRTMGRIVSPALLRTAIRCAAAALTMAAAAGATWLAVDALLPESPTAWLHLGREIVLVAAPVLIGAGWYAAALHLLRVEELQTLRDALMAKLRRG